MRFRGLPLLAACWTGAVPALAGPDPARPPAALATENAPESAEALYAAGKAALRRGDLGRARALFSAVLSRVPRHPYAEFYLARIRLAEKEGRAPRLEERLAALRVRGLDWRDVSLEEALEILRQEAAGAGLEANFVLLAPAGGESARFTLKLTDAPLTAVLDYMAQLTETELRYEDFAVVFDSPGPEPQAPPETGKASR